MSDILITWPKSRTLDSYLKALAKADRDNLIINFRVASLPIRAIRRCYVVHDGAVRGYNEVDRLVIYGENEVSRVKSDAWAGFWPAGSYIARKPKWFPVKPLPHKGFQGWRYYTYPQ